jgi:hypothetical protein
VFDEKGAINENDPWSFPRVAGMVRGAAADFTAYAANYGP